MSRMNVCYLLFTLSPLFLASFLSPLDSAANNIILLKKNPYVHTSSASLQLTKHARYPTPEICTFSISFLLVLLLFFFGLGSIVVFSLYSISHRLKPKPSPAQMSEGDGSVPKQTLRPLRHCCANRGRIQCVRGTLFVVPRWSTRPHFPGYMHR